MAHPVLQDEGRIPHLVKLTYRAAALIHPGAALHHIPRQQQGIFRPRLLGGKIVDFRVGPGGFLGDLLLGVEGVGHLNALVVVVDDEVQPRHRVRSGVAGILPQGPVGVFPGLFLPKAAPVPAVKARAHNAFVGVELGHRGFCGQVGSLGPGGRGQQRAQHQPRRADAQFFLGCEHIHDSFPSCRPRLVCRCRGRAAGVPNPIVTVRGRLVKTFARGAALCFGAKSAIL